MSGQVRILVTGSRDWADADVIGRALSQAVGLYGSHLVEWNAEADRWDFDWTGVTLVHGGARGADRVAGELAESWGIRTEVHEADWSKHGRAAGHRRNAQMVARGAAVCLAFPLGASRGTRGCMAMAEQAGIPVRVFGDVEVPS